MVDLHIHRILSLAVRTLCVTGLAASSIGCGGSARATRAEKQQLEETVSELRAQARRDRRHIQDLKHQLLEIEEKLSTSSSATSFEGEFGLDEELPELPVEILGEDDLGDDDLYVAGVGPDGGEIAYTGEALSESVKPSPNQYNLRGRKRPNDDYYGPLPQPLDDSRIAVTNGPVPKIDAGADRSVAQPAASEPAVRSAPVPAADDPKSEYRRHYQALQAGDHETAVVGFAGFVERYPNHKYADNAQYWLAEAHYDRKDFQRALGEFEKVVKKYPTGNKVPDATLKIGYCYAHMGDNRAARRALERVVARYPNSNPAALAARKLRNL